MIKRLAVIGAVIAVMMTTAPASVSAEPYGFDQTCNQLNEILEGGAASGIPSLGDVASAVCKAGNVASHPTEAATAVKDKAWDSTFGKVVDSLITGLGEAMTLAITFWVAVPNEAVSDSGTLFTTINDYTYQLQILLLIGSVIISGARLAAARRGAVVNEAAESFRLLARTVFASWMLGAVIVATARASDLFANWVLADATGGNVENISQLMIKTSSLQGFSPGLVLIIGLVGLLGALAQLALMILRQAMLVVAAGFLPLAAAGSGFGVGLESYRKLIGWIIAFLLWKPVAAIVYMIAFVTAGATDETTAGVGVGQLPTGEQAQQLLVSLVLLSSVAFVLPALMRLVAPAVAAVGSGGSGLNTAIGAIGTAATMGALSGTKARALTAPIRGFGGAARGAGIGGSGGAGLSGVTRGVSAARRATRQVGSSSTGRPTPGARAVRAAQRRVAPSPEAQAALWAHRQAAATPQAQASRAAQRLAAATPEGQAATAARQAAAATPEAQAARAAARQLPKGHAALVAAQRLAAATPEASAARAAQRRAAATPEGKAARAAQRLASATPEAQAARAARAAARAAAARAAAAQAAGGSAPARPVPPSPRDRFEEARRRRGDGPLGGHNVPR